MGGALNFAKISYAAGEISPLLFGRFDLTRYQTGLAVCDNFIVLPQGGVARRPPTLYIWPAWTDSILVPFRFSNTDAYAIEIGDEKARFFRNEGGGVYGVVLSGAVPYEVVLPYAAADLEDLTWTQSADILFLQHPSYPTRRLNRHAHDNWSVDLAPFENGPFADVNLDEAKTVKASAETGTAITLTATGFTFDEDLVGTQFFMAEKDRSLVAHWLTPEVLAAGNRRRYAGRVYETPNGGDTTATNPPIHLEGTEEMFSGNIKWTYLHSGWGSVKITAVAAGGATATADVIKRLPKAAVTPNTTYGWAEAAWNDRDGYPRAIGFHEQRLDFGNTAAFPSKLWMSIGAEYYNFNREDEEDPSIAYNLPGSNNQVNTIQWLVGGSDLAIGTSGEEMIARASSNREALMADNINITPASSEGSAAIAPVRVGGRLMFVARNRLRLYEFGYDFPSDGYAANDISIASEHITWPGIKQVVWHRDPLRVIWGRRDDGLLIGLTYQREHEVVGWHRHTMANAQVESMAVVPAADGRSEDLWLKNKRNIDGAEVHYIEVMPVHMDYAAPKSPDAAAFLDCQISYSGAATDTVTGLDHLEGETVGVMADGGNHDDVVVSSGSITLGREAQDITIGLRYRSRIKTLPVSAQLASGDLDGRKRRVKNLSIRMLATIGGLVGDIQDEDRMELIRPTGPGIMDVGPSLYGGMINSDVGQGWNKDGQIDVIQDLPFPMTILSIALNTEIAGG